LRVGRHSGAESVTLNGVRNIKIMEKKEPRNGYKQHCFSFAETAKTLWLAANDKDQRTNLLPFGWLLVEVEPWEQPAQDWPELAAACEPHLGTARAFAAQLDRQRQAMEEAREKAERQRREEEEKARQ
jgi:CRISPR-associated protein Csm5